ncbi:ergothioneine biosynthesis glutamate--cysteine ligase EgtA [Glycomyces paridis]|uniref:Glutamate--cysteine ligase EgtA n=1 Tax=Glycomyces paridis TaxID=2126555 RepID=A0A4S8PBF6_9ACTN|nr:ergothioneine biosynthesis glutamate--cysteine ligase EgtA [Glycomyces paridis]THV26482.1 ergothioneine biosynthesis glutamate--cysteine ligase EgtA [Glycomyces paridis]
MSDASLRDRAQAPPLTEAAAAERVAATAFGPSGPALVGAEVEWLVTSTADRRRRADPESLKAVLGVRDALPRCTRLTFEPGGALELSTPPLAGVRACFDALEADRARVGAALGDEGYELLGLGLDPVRLPRRVLRDQRYQAMEELFDQDGRAGRWMMANTASVQVCLDTGRDGPGPAGIAARWVLAHRLAPVLIAAFANSPLRRGAPSLWRSTRQHVWTAIDPTRARPVPHAHDPGRDPREDWARYALDARVMALRGPGRWTVPRGLTFRGWLRSATLRPPTADDLDYHLTTLFPPVRPRGAYLELRMIDAQPGPDWIVPVAVAAALFDDPAANAAAHEALEPLWRNATPGDLYLRAATAALLDAPIAAAARACFEGARAAQTDPAVAEAVDRFTESFVARGRTRADELVTGG